MFFQISNALNGGFRKQAFSNENVFFNICNILIPYQGHIPHFLRPVGTAFGKAGFGKEIVVDILVEEQTAAFHKRF